MAGHVVTAAAVRVVVGQSDLLIERGVALPKGVDAETVKRLLNKGMIAVVEEAETEGEAQVDAPLEKRTVDDLKALAADGGVDLSGAKSKAEILAALAAAQAPVPAESK